MVPSVNVFVLLVMLTKSEIDEKRSPKIGSGKRHQPKTKNHIEWNWIRIMNINKTTRIDPKTGRFILETQHKKQSQTHLFLSGSVVHVDDGNGRDFLSQTMLIDRILDHLALRTIRCITHEGERRRVDDNTWKYVMNNKLSFISSNLTHNCHTWSPACLSCRRLSPWQPMEMSAQRRSTTSM